MNEFLARPIDPRDVGWEVWDPAYRVRFWAPLASGGWTVRDFEVAAPDVSAALSWAEQHRERGEVTQVFAVVPQRDDLGVVRLVGDDPTRT
jgi:hypothetical protein